MLSREENERLTQTGPGTPMGSLIRRYWIPALFANQLPEPDGPPVRVTLLSEKLVAFRDTQGRVGLIDERCPHRTASLFFGRNEECGLRCVYHGWKFDVAGNCVDLPSEPQDRDFKRKIKITAYPCIERGGLVWTYMGPPDLRPEFPQIEWIAVPPSHRFVTRHIQECNWLQALEGGFDTSHLSFLHRNDGSKLDGVAMSLPIGYEVVSVECGFVAGTGRADTNGATSWTASLMLMPFHKLIATTPIGAHVWVPIDDENTMTYTIDYRAERPLDKEELEKFASGLWTHSENLPQSDRTIQNRGNDYLIDRALQKSGASFTGIKGFGAQDCGIQESMGPIADRTREHLGLSDSVIIKLRRLLLQTLDDFARGQPLPGLDPASYRMRAARFTLPVETAFADAVNGFVKIAP
jgi:phenylpropionate dioxygenase-like ring-hydroxylating dioxygenase large terminal subunit